jgi:hypothetical protein
MTLGQAQETFTKYLALLIIEANKLGYGARIREVQRTPEQQKLYVQQDKSWTMNSKHIECLAADIYFTKNGEIVYPETLGRYWEALDPKCKAGMFWKKKDSPHMEYQR